MNFLSILHSAQIVTTILSVICNCLLIYLILKHTKTKIGFYKWIMIGYAIFETLYSLVICLGMPAHFVMGGSWIVFTHGGLLEGTKYSYISSALYCTFYELWLGFLVIHFLYRYIAICRHRLLERIERSLKLKTILLLLFIAFITATVVCGMFFCTRQRMSRDMFDSLQKHFEHTNVSNVGYVILRTTASDGSFSVFGFITIVNHHILVILSVVTMLLCGYGIQKKIKALQNTNSRRVRMQNQLFLSLILQTSVPVIFCHIPSISYLMFPLLRTDFTLGSFSLIFTWLTSLEKVINPIIVAFCISDYRNVVLKWVHKEEESTISSGVDSGETHELLHKGTSTARTDV